MSLLFLDIFGIGIGLRYMNKHEYQTNFGVAITILIGCFLGVQIFLVGKEVINKSNPEVIFAERFVASPDRFNITRKTFNFAFGAQFPGNFSQFIDESIYTVTAEQVSMKKKYNQSSGDYYQEWQTLPIRVHPCSSKDFEVNESIDYFNKLAGLEQMYCLDYDSQNLFIEGNFDQDSYGLIQIKFRMCTGKQNCRDPSEIRKILTNSFVAHYTNDLIVNPKNVNPFQTISRDMYWSTNPIYPKDAYLYYRNIYFQTDNGIVFEEIETQRQPSLSYIQEQVIFGESDYFFAMYIRFEKAKESIYHRKYKKLDSILAEIGGIAKALVMIGFIICVPINQLQLYNQLSNSLFKYSNSEIAQTEQAHRTNHKIAGKTFVQIIEAQKMQSAKQIDQNSNQNQYQIYSQKQFIDKEQSLSYESQVQSPQCQNYITKNQITSNQSLREKSIDKIYKKELFQKQNEILKAKQKDFINSEKDCKQFRAEPQELISNQNDHNTKQINVQNSYYQQEAKNNFNLFNIIKITKEIKLKSTQKLQIPPQHEKEKNIEKYIHQKQLQQSIKDYNYKSQKSLAKLKQLLNQNDIQNQENERLKLKWSDYIRYYLWPFGSYAKKKKQIDYSVEKIYQHLDIIYIVKKLLEFEKVKQVLLNEDQRKLVQFFPKPLISVEEIEQEKLEEKKLSVSKKSSQKHDQKKLSINILNNQQKDEKEKAKEAFQALQNIIKQEKLSEVDKKILEMLDNSILENIHNNAEYLQEQINFEDLNSCALNDQRSIQRDNILSFNNQDFNQLVNIQSQHKNKQNEQIDIKYDQSNQQESFLDGQMPNEIGSQELTSMPQLNFVNIQQIQLNQTKNI
ncbi:transmembrane protein, putative (macronuclear) [Tetrahymena thermophila SB210]|uniref:Transmembrane protein, putative n=1 Tax=Tetrahymena thermophila (strain SB210) TaxID=312017 RepID=W7X0B0_TETTS|nr:transmembrane protein, putative [Tetrahymena thermophila SB210]EWS72545.1 transmembrane protein, putative [Tetrahymena thermophila SB210]|eukprot:XP_012654925.1 transmembrane protein, putative [Tetrahymena thermophila SB210]